MEIHSEECPEYRCQECRGSCAVFVLARNSEVRLCGSCFEKLLDLFHSATAITVATKVRDAGTSRKKLSVSEAESEVAVDRAPDLNCSVCVLLWFEPGFPHSM